MLSFFPNDVFYDNSRDIQFKVAVGEPDLYSLSTTKRKYEGFGWFKLYEISDNKEKNGVLCAVRQSDLASFADNDTFSELYRGLTFPHAHIINNSEKVYVCSISDVELISITISGSATIEETYLFAYSKVYIDEEAKQLYNITLRGQK